MTEETIFANARLILRDRVETGTLRIADGVITDIDFGTAVPKGAQDMQGDYIAPGLVELHTDNLERHMSPRPKVDWPHRAAILAHDRELAGTGITTVFDAIRVGSMISAEHQYQRYARGMVDTILAMRAAGALRISHHIHLRAEICSETLAEELAEFGPEDRVGIVSMMDHTPGQRQFRDLSKFEAYVRGKHSFDAAAFQRHVDTLYDVQKQYGKTHEAATVAAAARYGAALASHDDTTAEQVNVAALDLAKADRLDILSSDYVPAGLLIAALQLGDLWGDLARGLATVTHAPAQSVGLTDRGTIKVGARGDVIRFARLDALPILRETWVEGQRVF